MESISDEITHRFVQSYYKLYGLRIIKSKKEFCEIVGSAPSNFISMEKGMRSPTIENLYLLIKKLGISPGWIMIGEGDFIKS